MFVQKTLNCRGKLLDLSSPKVMGILNLTPDSFYDGGRWKTDSYLQQAEQMIRDGAAIIDVGGMSSRPGSDFVSEAEELERVLKPIEAIVRNFPEIIVSIDTWRANVAEAAASAGVHLINDISAGGFDEHLLPMVAKLGLPYILMHIQGTPKTMQENPQYDDIQTEVMDFFIAKLNKIRQLGIKDVILDLGFGFGKTLEQNYSLLAGMHNFQLLGLPILAGVSRKSMICKALKINPAEALNGTTAAHVLALAHGAKILRVHDVKEAVETIKIWNFYKKQALDTTFIPKLASKQL